MKELNLDPATTAVVLNDIQYGTLWQDTTPYLQHEVLANAVKIYEAARAAGVHIMHVRTEHLPGRTDEVHAVTDNPPRPQRPLVDREWELFDEVQRRDTEPISVKKGWSAFYGTDLELQLKRHGIKTVIMGGISTNYGVESTVRYAFELGFEIIVVEDASSGRGEGMHDWAMQNIFPRMGRVRSTEQVVAAINAARGA